MLYYPPDEEPSHGVDSVSSSISALTCEIFKPFVPRSAGFIVFSVLHEPIAINKPNIDLKIRPLASVLPKSIHYPCIVFHPMTIITTARNSTQSYCHFKYYIKITSNIVTRV